MTKRAEEDNTPQVKVYKTKLRGVTKEQHDYLMRCARVSDDVKSWYVKKLLQALKDDGVSVLSDFKKEIKEKYGPLEFRRAFNAEKKVNPDLFYTLGYSSYISDCAFINQKTNWKKRVSKGWFFANESANENNGEFYVQYNKKGRRFEREITDFYHIKGFPNFPADIGQKSFTVNRCSVINGRVIIPGTQGSKKLGIARQLEQSFALWERSFPLDDSHINSKNSYTTFSYDRKDWWVSITVPAESVPTPVVQETQYKYVLGIDAGIKTAITCSDGTVFTNPMIADKKLQELLAYEKELSAKMSQNIQSYKDRDAHYYTNQAGKKKLVKSCRYKNLKKRHDAVMVHIDRYKDYLLADKIIRNINWGSVSAVHLEDLNKSYWFKNHKWSSKLQRQCVGRIISGIEQKAKNLGIPVEKIPQTKEMASTQTCSKCGFKNPHMKDLSKRIFVCASCGHTMDRDLNAAINLANYIPTKEVDKKK